MEDITKGEFADKMNNVPPLDTLEFSGWHQLNVKGNQLRLQWQLTELDSLTSDSID
ncbi:hypothetical protein OK016_23420 [Vibrio chagasii]|nr:hypothetical protein [Vibrio chagasii]